MAPLMFLKGMYNSWQCCVLPLYDCYKTRSPHIFRARTLNIILTCACTSEGIPGSVEGLTSPHVVTIRTLRT